MRAVGLAANAASHGYWLLSSDGRVDSYNAPRYGSLYRAIPADQTVTAIAGE